MIMLLRNGTRIEALARSIIFISINKHNPIFSQVIPELPISLSPSDIYSFESALITRYLKTVIMQLSTGGNFVQKDQRKPFQYSIFLNFSISFSKKGKSVSQN